MAFALSVGCQLPFPAVEGASTSAVNGSVASWLRYCAVAVWPSADACPSSFIRHASVEQRAASEVDGD